MSQQYLVRPDTRPWIFQVWTAFAIAALLCVIGLWNLPHGGSDRAFLIVGFLFCASSSLTLAKTIRDNRDEQVDTDLWIVHVWIAFALAICVTLWGLIRIDLDVWKKGYFVASALFLISSTFVLAKTVRDNQESEILAGLAQAGEPAKQ